MKYTNSTQVTRQQVTRLTGVILSQVTQLTGVMCSIQSTGNLVVLV